MTTLTQPKINIRRSDDRGQANYGWLKTHHTFSFADYYDPKHQRFRSLRVINDDIVAPGHGFDMHPHHNMEIVSYIVEGQLEHKDSMGNGSVIQAGQVQKISAGTGILHSEFNPSSTDKTRLLQIWIIPDTKDAVPSYQQVTVDDLPFIDGLTLIADKAGKSCVKIHQDAKLFLGKLNNQEIIYQTTPDRGLWLQMIRGQLTVNQQNLTEGDGVSIENISQIELLTKYSAEFLLFDLK